MKYIEVTRQHYHLQGFTSDGTHMYWSFTDRLVKTTLSGTVISQALSPLPHEHLGGLEYYDGKLYIAAMGKRLAGDPDKRWSSFTVHVYDAATLTLFRVMRFDDCYPEAAVYQDGFAGLGALTVGPDPVTGEPSMMIATAIQNSPEHNAQVVLQYSLSGKRTGRYLVPTGSNNLGIQNISRDPETGFYWLTAYNPSEPYMDPNTLFCVSADFSHVIEALQYSTPYGIQALGGGRFYLSLSTGVNGARVGYAYEADLEFIRSHKISEGTSKIILPYLTEFGL